MVEVCSIGLVEDELLCQSCEGWRGPGAVVHDAPLVAEVSTLPKGWCHLKNTIVPVLGLLQRVHGLEVPRLGPGDRLLLAPGVKVRRVGVVAAHRGRGIRFGALLIGLKDAGDGIQTWCR